MAALWHLLGPLGILPSSLPCARLKSMCCIFRLYPFSLSLLVSLDIYLVYALPSYSRFGCWIQNRSMLTLLGRKLRGKNYRHKELVSVWLQIQEKALCACPQWPLLQYSCTNTDEMVLYFFVPVSCSPLNGVLQGSWGEDHQALWLHS